MKLEGSRDMSLGRVAPNGGGGLTRRDLLRRSALLSAVSGLALMGCSPQGQGGSSQNSRAINVAVFSHFEELDRKLARRYERRTEKSVKFEALVADNHRDKIIGSLRAGSSPWDVIPLWSFLTPEMASRGWLADLTDRIEDEFGSDFEQFVGGDAPFQNGLYEGRRYGVPVDVGGTILHWNKELLKKRGLDPEAPAGWHETAGSTEEFVRYAKELTFEEGGVQHWGFSDNWAEQAAITFNTFIQMFGGQCMDLSDEKDAYGEVTFHEGPGVEALQFMVDLLHTHKVVDPASVTYNWVFDITPGYLDGRVGFISTWPFVAGLAEDPEQSKIAGAAGHAPNFAAVTSATSQDPHYIAIPESAPGGVDAAWEYVKTRLSTPAQREQGEEGAWAPIYEDLYQEPAVREKFIQADVIVKSLEYPSSLSVTPDYMEWRSTLNTAISQALSQDKTPQEALNEAAEQVKASRG